MKVRLLAIISGEYGQRHVANIREHSLPEWTVDIWQAPARLPLVLDDPADYVPTTLPPADLILSFGEQPGIAELLPDVARITGARAVIAPVDNEAWLPRGLARQLRGWLQELGLVCVTPKPLCSLTERRYNIGRKVWIEYDDPFIAEFARSFGQPKLSLTLDPHTRQITGAEVVRDTVCGCARFVAQGLVGVSADEAEQEAGMLHHHYPCLASMGLDADYGDTLLHVSGNFIKDDVGEQVKSFKRVQYIAPGTRSE